jgi:hypothetical protein
VGASLRGFRLTNFLKEAQAKEVFEYKGGHMAFCKSPDMTELKRHFENLIDPPGRFYFLYFSDDACLAIRGPTGRVDRYNLDISSCDASHGSALFEQLIKIVPQGAAQHDMELLVAQCQLPLRIVSKSNSQHVLIVQPKEPKLYSGSTITTGINNLANLAIGISIAEAQYTGQTVNGVSVEIQDAAEKAGYIITGCDALQEIEDIQFLKNSPVLDNAGQWHPMLNFGVFLRASGTCDGDLPGRGPLKSRAEAFQRGLLQGAYPRTHSEFLDTMRMTYGNGPITETKTFERKVEAGQYPAYDVNSDSFCKRYRLDSTEYNDVLTFAQGGYGLAHNAPGLSKILTKDYGLKCVYQDNSQYLAFQLPTPNSTTLT